MPKFYVEVEMPAYATRSIPVEADSVEAAKAIALERAKARVTQSEWVLEFTPDGEPAVMDVYNEQGQSVMEAEEEG